MRNLVENDLNKISHFVRNDRFSCHFEGAVATEKSCREWWLRFLTLFEMTVGWLRFLTSFEMTAGWLGFLTLFEMTVGWLRFLTSFEMTGFLVISKER